MARGTQVDIVDGLSSSVGIKGPVYLATTANVTLAGLQTIDGTVLTDGKRVLVRAQTDATENGIYVVSTGNWRRARDFSRNDDVKEGTQVRVTDGATGSGVWVLTSADPIVFETSDIVFARDNTLTDGALLKSQNLDDLLSAIAGWDALARYDQTQVVAPAATVLNLSTATAPFIDVSAGAVSTVTLGNTRFRVVRFTGATVFTVGANLIGNNNGENITTAADDVGIFMRGADGKVRFTWLPAAGTPRASTTEVLTGSEATKVATPNAIAALWEKGADIASGSTITIGEGGYFHITGTTTITDIDFATAKDGRTATLIFDGALTLTHNSTTLKLPGGQNIITAAGDRAVVVQDSSDNVVVTAYIRAGGVPSAMLLSTSVATTSGTSIDFTGIPAWVKRITVMPVGVSTNGSSTVMIQLGDSGGVETSGYSSAGGSISGTTISAFNSTSNGLQFSGGQAAGDAYSGRYTITLQTGTTWVMQGGAQIAGSTMAFAAGAKTLSATLDRIRLTTTGGANTFDAGTINILLEG